MKIAIRPPCGECPFRKKSLRGWLGPDTPHIAYAKVHADTESGYACHMDVEAKVAEGWKLSDPAIPEIVEQCTGALLHAAKTCKRYEDPKRQAARNALKEVYGTDAVLRGHRSHLQNPEFRVS